MSTPANLLAWLTEFGLNGHQAELYLAALAQGEATASSLATDLGLGRTAVYDRLRALEERGLIRTVSRGKRKVFVPLHPKELLRRAEQQRTQLQDLLPDFLSLYADRGRQPFVQLFTGPLAAREIYEDILESAKDEYVYFSPAALTLQNVDRRYIETWIGRRLRAGLRSRSLRVKAQEVPLPLFREGAKYQRQIRYLPAYVDLQAAIYIYGHNVGVIATRKEGACFIIHSPNLAYSFRQIFEFLWQISLKG